MDNGGTPTWGDGHGAAGLGGAPPSVAPLGGRALRLVLLHELSHRREATIADLVRAVADYPMLDGARPSKLVSDALRWEIRAGRIHRPSRGRYRFVTATRSRLRRAGLLADTSRRWLLARDQDLPWQDPPWHTLGWLWAR